MGQLPFVGGPWNAQRWATLAVGVLLVWACAYVKVVALVVAAGTSITTQTVIGGVGLILIGTALKTPGHKVHDEKTGAPK